MTAWTEEEEGLLDGILKKAFINGVDDAELITAKAVLSKEPKLSSRVRAAIYVPREYVIDPWTAPYVTCFRRYKTGHPYCAAAKY